MRWQLRQISRRSSLGADTSSAGGKFFQLRESPSKFSSDASGSIVKDMDNGPKLHFCLAILAVNDAAYTRPSFSPPVNSTASVNPACHTPTTQSMTFEERRIICYLPLLEKAYGVRS